MTPTETIILHNPPDDFKIEPDDQEDVLTIISLPLTSQDEVEVDPSQRPADPENIDGPIDVQVKIEPAYLENDIDEYGAYEIADSEMIHTIETLSKTQNESKSNPRKKKVNCQLKKPTKPPKPEIKKRQQKTDKTLNKTSKQPASKQKNETTKKVTKHPEFEIKSKMIDSVLHYVCDICGKDIFLKRENLLAHRARHIVETTPCKLCNFIARNRTNMLEHMRFMHRDKKCICDLCGTECARKRLMQAHIEAVHLRKKKYGCQICGKSFGDASTLRRHRKIHTSEKDRLCDICGYRTFVKERIRYHMNQHDKNRNVLCNICGKMYAGLKSLRTHKVVMHLGGQKTTSGKPLKCTICHREFKMRAKVREHM